MAKDAQSTKTTPPDRTIKTLLVVIAAGLIFAAGRWTADGGRLAELEAEQNRLKDQVAAIGGGNAARTPPAGTAGAAPAAGLKSGIDLVVAGRPFLGRESAAVTLVEFSDFQCPFCGRYVRETLPRIKAEFVDTGKVRYVFRHYPIADLHPEAPTSARAADCAHAQGKFWPMHDRLFTNPRGHSADALGAHAAAVGVNMTAYSSCMTGTPRPLLSEDMEAGARGGAGGTPAFFIGSSSGAGPVRVTHTVYGAKPFEAFKAALDSALLAAASSR